MEGLDLGRVALAVGICAAFGIGGGLLAGDALTSWYPTLTKPRIQIPTPLFVLVGIIVYVLEAIALYRLFDLVDGTPGPTIALVALLVVMLYNELWNAALFRLRSVFAAWIGLLGFLAPLTILLVALALVDAVSAVLLCVYAVWVVAYDVPWIYQLWRANPGGAVEARD